MCVVCPWAECIAVYVHISKCTVYVTLIQSCDDGGNKGYKMRNKGKSYVRLYYIKSRLQIILFQYIYIKTAPTSKLSACVWLLLIETAQKRKKEYQIIHSNMFYGKACDAASVLFKVLLLSSRVHRFIKCSFII